MINTNQVLQNIKSSQVAFAKSNIDDPKIYFNESEIVDLFKQITNIQNIRISESPFIIYNNKSYQISTKQFDTIDSMIEYINTIDDNQILYIYLFYKMDNKIYLRSVIINE